MPPGKGGDPPAPGGRRDRTLHGHPAHAGPGRLDAVRVPHAVVDDDPVADAERLARTDLEGLVEEEGGVEEVRPALAVGRGPGAPVEGDRVARVVRVIEHRDAGGRAVDRARQVDPPRRLADHPLLLGPRVEEQAGVDEVAGALAGPGRRSRPTS